MKIAFVNKFFFNKGGQETLMFEEAELLNQKGHETCFFSMQHPQNKENYEYEKFFISYMELSNQGKEYGFLDKIKIASKFIYNKEAKNKFNKFLEETKPDLIHLHGIAHQITYSILPIAKLHGIPIVQTLHDYQLICPCYTLLKSGNKICDVKNCSDLFYINCLSNNCVKNSRMASLLSTIEMSFNHKIMKYSNLIDKFICPSNFLSEIVTEKGWDKSKFIYIPNFINNIDKVSPNYDNENYFLYFGRLSYEKGLFTLLRAFKTLPESKLKIAGTGPLLEEINNYISENKIKNVELVGFQSGDRLDKLIKESVAVILPSEWYENAPMSIIESFSRGKPVIASNLGGVKEMVINDQTGFLFEYGKCDDLCRKIQCFSENPSLSSQLGQSARNFALKSYNADIHVEKLLGLYRSLMRL